MNSRPTEIEPKLNLEIHTVTNNDFEVFMEPLFSVMGRATFVSALWPNNQTELGRKRAKERWLEEMKLHPGIRWVKVVNTEETESDGKTHKIVAVAQWAILEPGKKYPEVPDLMCEEDWPSSTEKRWGLDLWESYIQPRRAVMKKETEHPILSLQILCTWPRYWRHGAGGMLVKYGCDIADKLNAVSVVESSGMGEPLYSKWGFIVKTTFKLQSREEFNDRERGNIIFMVRPRPGEDSYSIPGYNS